MSCDLGKLEPARSSTLCRRWGMLCCSMQQQQREVFRHHERRKLQCPCVREFLSSFSFLNSDFVFFFWSFLPRLWCLAFGCSADIGGGGGEDRLGRGKRAKERLGQSGRPSTRPRWFHHFLGPARAGLYLLTLLCFFLPCNQLGRRIFAMIACLVQKGMNPITLLVLLPPPQR